MSFEISRRCAVLALGAYAVPTMSFAQSSEPKSGDPLTVELTGVPLPVVRGGVLINYLFGVINIQLSDAQSTFFLRENSFLLRDAIIRIAARSPIPAGDGPKTYDRVAVTRVVLRAIQAIRPTARVVRVTVLDAAFMRN